MLQLSVRYWSHKSLSFQLFTLSTLPAALATDGENAADVKLIRAIRAIHGTRSEHQYCD